MSSSGQTQFRYTQTPSKVVHLRNLPWECVEEELIDLCKRFGKIVNTKSNVGANRNQAFVEFADLNQAISMVSYYASSSEPAQIRGKTVYIQYSNRHEIVNNQSPGDVPGNVLLVTFEGVESHEVSIDVIHLVFSAFGFVHKIATFEKAAGFQALVQFSDVETASAARNALDGRSIPRQAQTLYACPLTPVYLLPEHVASCNLRMSYSAHTDLNIKFQSHRSRDYTNPYLPVNHTAMDGSMQPALGADGKKVETQSNVLLALIENMQYAVTVDVLHTVFSAYGTVQKIAIFEKNGSTQALIQYSDIATAAIAKEALEGHCIYDGGYCKLRLSYSRHFDLNVKRQHLGTKLLLYAYEQIQYPISLFERRSWDFFQLRGGISFLILIGFDLISGSISVCNSVDQAPALIMANSSDLQPKPSRNSRKSYTASPPTCSKFPVCDGSQSAAVDVVILIAVITACGFLFLPYVKLVTLKSIEVFSDLSALVKEEILQNPIRCGKPDCKGLRKAVEFDIQLETEECVKSSNNSSSKKGRFELPRVHHRELEAELKKMAPPNGRAVLVFRARCGCSVRRLVVSGPKKQQRKMKK
ncbi:unnamed protein product [Thlaspi arvense]|uniref:RRM domain-containing protein n=1 Tax=Thlaspi arvense TaxID=13288 RepID=A0AAU9S234_THLAR|nr:unnamed protein product [Thlaspi arvense]